MPSLTDILPSCRDLVAEKAPDSIHTEDSGLSDKELGQLFARLGHERRNLVYTP